MRLKCNNARRALGRVPGNGKSRKYFLLLLLLLVLNMSSSSSSSSSYFIIVFVALSVCLLTSAP